MRLRNKVISVLSALGIAFAGLTGAVNADVDSIYNIIKDDGLVLLEADSDTWAVNSSTKEEKLQAVKTYINEYLVGDLAGVTADVTYSEAEEAYKVVLNGEGEKYLRNLNFKYSQKVYEDDFNYASYANIPARHYELTLNGTASNSPNANDNMQESSWVISANTNTDFRKEVGWTHEIFASNHFGKAYVYETRFAVEDFLEIPAGASRNDYYSAATLLNNLNSMFIFTVEEDGLYYGVTDGNTAYKYIWTKVPDFTTDNDFHTYKVIVDGFSAQFYVDGVLVADNIELGTYALPTNRVIFGYKAGTGKSSTSDAVKMKLDRQKLTTFYHNEVYIPDLKNIETDPNVVKLADCFEVGELKMGTGAGNFSKAVLINDTAASGAEFTYKLPDGAYLTDFTYYGLLTHLQLEDAGYTNSNIWIWNNHNPGTPAGIQKGFYFSPWNLKFTDKGNLKVPPGSYSHYTLGGAALEELSNKNYNRIKMWASMENLTGADAGKVKPGFLSDIVIEYAIPSYEGHYLGAKSVSADEEVKLVSDTLDMKFSVDTSKFTQMAKDGFKINGEDITPVFDGNYIKLKPADGFKFGTEYLVTVPEALANSGITNIPETITFKTVEDRFSVSSDVIFTDKKAGFSIMNNSGATEPAIIMLMVYNDGVLAEIVTKKVTLNNGNNLLETEEVTNAFTDTDKVKVMVWDADCNALIPTIIK